ncbi:helix-turn-helix domain-containing protein [Ligilactobacillus murinus]|uniref:Helix-turn-helix domain-containing protein n=1 Tax=Ligilactobacillus murinus TaxID=1622 RepID=A0A4Q2AY30_9LACO|nr:helix-turn-helix domain-containing protein [Ligilactobacillus murinus]NBH84681.1 helix-turn-helix domain-containing protein [Lachnospiraceae bacterium]MCR1896261.1 helix-turn-helix domain-containing protein [Ligilactobacillus murinus]NBH40230.1 helix-turn-helix domain-containing protein [Ligilactobacillus murinus]RII81439.1 helix-turn-helix domain-containing protein [Ligilactobacillus murinus]RXV75329.1 helix-turn-helix domain-containing protein [Ligilactobacillus murinus]
MEHPSYYSILTADVRYDKRLKPNEKLLFSEITALSNKRGYCNASNNYFAQLYDVTTVTASNWVNHLKDRGYIDVEMIYDGKQIKERRIFVNSNPIKENFNTPKEKVEDPIKNNFKGGIKEKFKENITRFNNTSKNKQLEEDFEKLWKLYPRKEGKKKAFEAYKRAIKNGTTNKEIQTGIVNYLTQIRVQRTNKQYIKQGSTWFNGECWNDEYNVGQERSPVNPKTVPSSAPAERTVADLEREQRESRRDAFPMQYKNHPEWFNEETIKNILEEFPELREKVAEIDRARATSDSNTA